MMKKQGLYDPANEHDACGVGFVANMNGFRDHLIIKDGIQILCNLEHRGAVGGDLKTGDGAGMLMQMPHKFLDKVTDFKLPEEGSYGAGMIFLPVKKSSQNQAVQMTERIIQDYGATLLGWRDVPVTPDCLGDQARSVMPSFKQIFLTINGLSGPALEVKLYILRKKMENKALENGYSPEEYYISSLSSRTMIYKGMFVSTQFVTFYPDLDDEDFESALALVHQRYSTNTFPSWPLAQPFRYMAHNGEINTLRRNRNNMTAREKSLKSDIFGDEINDLFPIVQDGGSDSAVFDNVFELLSMGGRTMEHTMMMMVPEAFGVKYHMSEDKRAFFEYHTAVMEPWDGPAALVFTDGTRIGATLDRNGLRPGRYTITRSGRVVMASETGVLDIAADDILEKGRLAPGKMFMVDTENGRFIRDNELKSMISRKKPYRRWLEQNKIELKGLLGVPQPIKNDSEKIIRDLKSFGYSLEDMKTIIAPMARNSQEPLGSMGNDEPLAVLSDRPVLMYDYFRQLFAQVTNPPIDPYRENLVMSLMSFVGKEHNLLDETPRHCRQLKLAHPVLTNDDINRLKESEIEGFSISSVPMLFHAHKVGLKKAVDKLCKDVENKIDNGDSLIILSDRGTDSQFVAIPALLAVSAVHHYLVKAGKRHLAGLLIETAEAREVHHIATLIGFGASGINPYLVFESMSDLKARGYLDDNLTMQAAVENYITAVKKGLLKVMSKMGVSTIRSYRGSQIYEAVGLDEKFVEEYFTGTSSLIGGIGFDSVENDLLKRHDSAYSEIELDSSRLESGGRYNYRKFSNKHLFSPEAVINLQKAVRNSDYSIFKIYSAEVNNISKNLCTLRGLFRFKESKAILIDEVESVDSIVKRFVSSAMSFGSISKEAHETMAIAMNRIGGMSNSGEGGEDEERYKILPNGDDRRSHVKQVASGRFGVSSHYLANGDELQIKMAQGAKPGEGGQLPGHKVNDVIARVRHSTPGVMLISPPPHHDIYSIEDLSQLIFDLKNSNPDARVSVKLVSEVGVGTVAAGVAKGKADMVLISGSDGGTGASPLSSIKYAGSYWEIGLAETQQVLLMNQLRDKIRVQVDGQIKTGRDVVIGAMLGAEEFGFGTTSLVSLGCIVMRKCHTNSCPVGIATQRPELRKCFTGKPEHLVNFMRFVAEEVREIMAQMGFRTFEEMVGRVDMIEVNDAVAHYKEKGLDFSRVLHRPELPEGYPLHCTTGQQHDFSLSLDPELIVKAEDALENGNPVVISQLIRNYNRTVGATLSSRISKKYGSVGLPDDTIHINFKGSAGQSYGAFLARGITFELEGDTNDYMGKGLSGGKIVVYPPRNASYRAERNIATGNVTLFGATGGEVFINGKAGERFGVRNSGAEAVVEGVGDHACEYMTGGRVICLGETGINFAAGMSGGIAYVYDENQLFDTRCNLEMVDIEPVQHNEDKDYLESMIQKHIKLTGSALAKRLLDNWDEAGPLFVKVMPIDYRRALEQIKERQMKDSDDPTMTEEVYA